MAIDPLLAAKITFVLGWTNILSILLVMFSCRCVFNVKMPKLQESKAFKAIYKYHCIYWRVFIVSVIAHAVFATMAFGNPFW